MEEFIFITGRNKNAINNYLAYVFELEHILDSKEKIDILAKTRDWITCHESIVFIGQRKPLGIDHIVWCSCDLIHKEAFAIILPNELFISESGNSLLKKMVEAHADIGATPIAASKVLLKDVNKYGIVKPDIQLSSTCFKISDMIEKPTPQNAPYDFSIAGSYILNSSIFDYLENSEMGSNGEIQLTDAMRCMLENEVF